MKEIQLTNIFNFTKAEKSIVKIKFNIWNGITSPLDEYKLNPEVVNNDWFLYKPPSGKKYFNDGDIAMNFIPLEKNTWLLTSVKRIVKNLDVTNDIGYEAIVISEYEQYFGRLIIKFHKYFKGTVIKLSNFESKLVLLTILPSSYEDNEFPGYENVRLSFQSLQQILERNKSSWIGALKNQKAVYLITDTKKGKFYVGSATSQYGMLLQRWKDYISNGTGGNKILEKIKKEYGFNYIKENFEYCILENYNARIDDKYVISRESWWKSTLKSRMFGYNAN